MHVRRAELDGVFQDLVNKPDDRRVLGGFVEVIVGATVLVDHQQTGLVVERIDGIGTHPEPLLHFPLDHLGRGQHGTEPQARERLQSIEALGREEPASRDLDLIVDAPQREQFVAQQQASGKQREHLFVGLEFVERGVADAIFLREPPQDALFSERVGGTMLREKCARISGRELSGRDHAAEQFGHSAAGAA